MNAISSPPTAPEATPDAASQAFDHAAFHELSPGVPDAQRYDGWTPDCQQRFLTALARGISVQKACNIVGLSRQSAYAFRGSARGAAFALAWEAALLRARDVLADELMERAFSGVRDTVTYDDGRIVTRHRYDNQLAWKMLARLDRRADAAAPTDAAGAAVRLAAADFEQFLDLLARDAVPARAGLFLAARLGAEATPASEDDLAPIRALARADRWLRTHVDAAQPIVTADLDVDRRADWTAEQWLRAEAAGLLQVTPAPEAPTPETDADDTDDNCQLRQPGEEDDGPTPRIFWSEHDQDWRTDFPPPPGFTGASLGEPDDPGYERALTDEEEAARAACRDRALAAIVANGLAQRDAWLAATRMEREPAVETPEIQALYDLTAGLTPPPSPA